MAERAMRPRTPPFTWTPLHRDDLPPDWQQLSPEDIGDRASLIGEWVRNVDVIFGPVKVGQV